MTQQNSLRAVFWAVLVLFLAWDHLHSPPWTCASRHR